MKYFIEISYRGTLYSGWQRQDNSPSVQQTIEKSICKITKQALAIHGCGRTDAGVHAIQYFFHIVVDEEISTADFIFKMNNSLPEEIAVHAMYQVSSKCNAQRDAMNRRYDYFVHFDSDPFINDLSYLSRHSDLEAADIRAAMQALEGSHDFTNFCKRPDSNSSCICTISHAGLAISENGKNWRFRFEGNRFLHNMIRLLMGNLLAIGQGKLSQASFLSYLDRSDEPDFHLLAKPHGLYLSMVEYDFLKRIERSTPFFNR